MKTIAAGSIKKGCLKFQALIFFGSLILTGCTVGPDYHPPRDQLPTHFINAKKKPSPEDVDAYWWRSIKDPVLASLINQALQRNLDIQQAQAKIRQSRAELNIATADFLPELNVTGKVSRDHLSRNSELISSIPFSIPLNYTDTKMEFDASWELDIFGHTRRTVEASKATLQSTIESMNDMALRVTAEVAKDYIQYRVYQQRINIATSTINSYKKTAKLIRLLLKAGNATAIDLQRTESQTLSAEATLPSLQAESRATLSALAVMIDESPES
jgi:NodT family efflux transporter outer membrane factor (OMF) lipoprotein